MPHPSKTLIKKAGVVKSCFWFLICTLSFYAFQESNYIFPVIYDKPMLRPILRVYGYLGQEPPRLCVQNILVFDSGFSRLDVQRMGAESHATVVKSEFSSNRFQSSVVIRGNGFTAIVFFPCFVGNGLCWSIKRSIF